MNPATVQLIIALLPLAEKLVFEIGGKVVEIATADFTDPQEIQKAFAAAAAEGFPAFQFRVAASTGA